MTQKPKMNQEHCGMRIRFVISKVIHLDLESESFLLSFTMTLIVLQKVCFTSVVLLSRRIGRSPIFLDLSMFTIDNDPTDRRPQMNT